MERIFKSVPSKRYVRWFKHQRPKPKTWDELPSSEPQHVVDGINYYSKDAMRKELFEEQMGICCYCNKKFKTNDSQILEHFLPRLPHSNLAQAWRTFDYYNIFLSCDGNTKREKDKKFHCDKLKEDREIRLNPSISKHLKELRYDDQGGIYSNTEIGNEAISTLGLDCITLINRRKEILKDYVINSADKKFVSKTHRKSFLEVYAKPVEFRHQILQVLLNDMTRIDKSICFFCLGVYNLKRKAANYTKIILNLCRYKYKFD